jgi:hypothetical protein
MSNRINVKFQGGENQNKKVVLESPVHPSIK